MVDSVSRRVGRARGLRRNPPGRWFLPNKGDFAGGVLTPPLTKGGLRENHFAPFGNPRSLPPRQERGEYELMYPAPTR